MTLPRPQSGSLTFRYVDVMWLRCVDEDRHLYVDCVEDVALLNSAVHNDEDLSVENVALDVNDGQSSARSSNNAKRGSRVTAAEKETADFLRLSDSGFKSIIRSGLSHFS